MTSIRLWTGVLSLFIFLTITNSAVASCGNISHQSYDGGDELVYIIVPIVDCDNPFNADVPAAFEVDLIVQKQVVEEGATIEIIGDEPVKISYVINKPGNFVFEPFSLYKKDGVDYVKIPPMESNPFVANRTFPSLLAGEYTGVFIFEEPPIFSQAKPSLKQWIKNIFMIQTAHAFRGSMGISETVTISFTIEHALPEPTGASSVLFLPGIQASRLYTEGALGTENRLWEPNRNEDVRTLAMTEAGKSIADIYTNDVLDKIFGLGNVYNSFLELLEDMEEEGIIKEFVPFAYDWRYDVFSVATQPVLYPDGEEKLLLEEIKRLAGESHTGKVTIVAHSNGGLVAKALLHEYGTGELAGLVDKVVMVGVPQLGTPKAIGSVLHGIDQGTLIGVTLNPGVIRETTLNLPGAYGLLPTAKYLEEYGEDMITSDNSVLAEPVSSYGDLSSYENFVDFLVDKKTTRNTVTNISQPVTLKTGLMNKTVSNQKILDIWKAPEGVDVYEVAGTGNPTIKSFHYREFSCPEDNPMCILNPYVKPVLTFTTEGDETVVLNSATAYEGYKTRFVVDLDSESAGLLNDDISHINLTESESVQIFVGSVIKYPYVTDTIIATEFSEISHTYKIIGVHSPVSITVADSAGNITGRDGDEIKEEVAGSSYIEFAGSKYVIIPGDSEVEVLLVGEEAGSYSLTIEELHESGEQVLLQEMLGATSTIGMAVVFSCDEVECSESIIDYDADGKTDATFDWAGTYQSLVVPEVMSEESVEERKTSQSSATRVREVSSPMGLVAGMTTSQDNVRMWEMLLQLKDVLDTLEIYYNLKN